MTARAGTVTDTYAAALQHDLVDVGDATLVGVVRRPTRWFSPAVDENHPSLGPPPALLDEFQDLREDFEMRGLCAEGAHNAAWDDLDVETRYREHLQTDAAAREAVDELVDRVRGGEDVALVCFENTEQKRCHRTALLDHLRERLDAT
ncbi:MAG: DUF488 family protein [Halobacteriaceae archaeon]